MKKGFIQIPILIAIIVGVLAVGGGSYFGVKQYQNYQAIIEKEKQTPQSSEQSPIIENEKVSPSAPIASTPSQSSSPSSAPKPALTLNSSSVPTLAPASMPSPSPPSSPSSPSPTPAPSLSPSPSPTPSLTPTPVQSTTPTPSPSLSSTPTPTTVEPKTPKELMPDKPIIDSFCDNIGNCVHSQFADKNSNSYLSTQPTIRVGETLDFTIKVSGEETSGVLAFIIPQDYDGGSLGRKPWVTDLTYTKTFSEEDVSAVGFPIYAYIKSQNDNYHRRPVCNWIDYPCDDSATLTYIVLPF